MKNASKSDKSPKVGFTLGRRGFEKISAVEGLTVTREMREDLREFDRRGLSGQERRRAISEKYGKSKRS